ncbi:DUF417 family protein [Bradyrhizobium sp. CCGB12]|uniref:DUF417 family protein n=1 Tax=Bradyrhizobium sp. CCGB12 TaxID=2949632 RepID=UPI0028123389|nr:DUF417 family protein [Bradyrhizobium sp. CCGB12]
MLDTMAARAIDLGTRRSDGRIANARPRWSLVSWLSLFGFRGEAYVLGVTEFVIAILLIAGAFSPVLSALGSFMGVVTFMVTWSFFFTTPGVVKWSISTDPMAWNLAGEFLFKDIVLLCVCVVLLFASLPQTITRLRA